MARPKTGRKPEYKFFVAMTEEERETIRKNMENLRKEHKITLSALLRKVMIEHMNNEDFLKYIGLL